MNPILLSNSLTKKKEEFKPIIPNTVSMYHCGPTVYSRAHIGNLRPYIISDTLRRLFEYRGFKVNQVINITDVGHLTGDADDGEDKLEKKSREIGEKAKNIAEKYTNLFKQDLSLLNIKTNDTKFPKVTEHIADQIDLIKKLESKGYTYNIDDGVYFDTSKFPDYGILGGISNDESKARIENVIGKKNIRDFALWKLTPKDVIREQEWESPWGRGFPGWHIECSAMSMKYLGETFDIHTGGIDHLPIHHNDEIAQSVCATGKPLANYWMHVAFVTLKTFGFFERKLAKSQGDVLSLDELASNGISPLAYRLWVLGAKYGTTVSFSINALKASEKALKGLIEAVWGLGNQISPAPQNYLDRLINSISDDLNTPLAVSLIFDCLKDKSLSNSEKLGFIHEADKLLGLDLSHNRPILIPDEVQNLASQRQEARDAGDYNTSDKLRDKINELGWDVRDTEEGQLILPR